MGHLRFSSSKGYHYYFAIYHLLCFPKIYHHQLFVVLYMYMYAVCEILAVYFGKL